MKKQKPDAGELALCGLFTALTAAGAFLKIPMPGMPISLQTLFTTLAGLLLGPRLGAFSVGAYILLGLAGAPVFSMGGGLSHVLRPSFGYILGFLLGTILTGIVAGRKETPSVSRLFVAGLAGAAAVYLVGLPYYYLVANVYLRSPVGAAALMVNGFLLTVPGDVVKCFLAAVLAGRLLPRLRERKEARPAPAGKREEKNKEAG